MSARYRTARTRWPATMTVKFQLPLSGADATLVAQLAKRQDLSNAEFIRRLLLPIVRDLAAEAAVERIGASGERRPGRLIEFDP